MLLKGQQSLTHKGSLAERFAGARQIFTQQLLEEIFSFNEIDNSLMKLDFQINQHKEKLNTEAADWIENFKSHIYADKDSGLKIHRPYFFFNERRSCN